MQGITLDMKKKILILDDNNDVLEILTMLLTDFGYDIKPLSSGEKVFEEINQFQPNLLIMDVMIAGMNGISICKEIKRNIQTALLPVILMSGSQDLNKILENPGAPEDFLAKPFDIDIVISKIEEHIRV